MYTIFFPEDTDVTKLLKSQLALCECLSDGRHAPFFEANFSVSDSQVLNERIGRQEDYLGNVSIVSPAAKRNTDDNLDKNDSKRMEKTLRIVSI